ncbi:MAG: redoxin domain-containing protein [Fimbriimonadaceae bacterium]|nr:redoxin domain-containing protein [Fimbriimonadaceae bacterium]
MKVAKLLAFAVFAIGAVTLFLVTTGTIKRVPKEEIAETTLAESTPRHPVTEKMVKVSEEYTRKAAPDFKLKDVAGVEYSLDSLTKSGPTVLIAVLEGCPCTTDSQPLFNAMAKKFDGKANFVGLFTQGPARIDQWTKDHSVKFPILVDEDGKVCKAYGLENSVYTVLLRSDKTIEKIWPGYSQAMLMELDSKLSELTGFAGTPFDAAYAPVKYSSGCNIYFGEATEEVKKLDPELSN